MEILAIILLLAAVFFATYLFYCIGQGVYCRIYRALIGKLHDFLKQKIEQGSKFLNKVTAETWQPSLFADV